MKNRILTLLGEKAAHRRLRAAIVPILTLLAAACAQIPAVDHPKGPAAIATAPPSQNEVPAEVSPPPVETSPSPTPPEAVISTPAAAPPLAQEQFEAAPEPPVTSLWVRIRKGFAMHELDGPRVREWEQWYSSRPDYVARMVERSRRVLFHVVEEVERRKMPTEIALLPMVESAYNPQAHSRAHASGMWQFIPSTGKLYGLQQNWWYDGRRDIVAATSAALDYLEKLHATFGNWQLALASYNWGEGAVSRAVARNEARGLPADYEDLAMPEETRNYLPKLQAIKNIVSDPARFGLTLADIPNESYFATVTIPRHIDVALAARFAEISIDEFRFLNPAHNKPVINANAAETIVVPKDKVETFQHNLENHTRPLVSWQAYTVKRGERIERIAAKYHISLAELKRINKMAPRTRVRTGQPLLVPVRAGMKPHLPNLPAPKLVKTRAVKKRVAHSGRAHLRKVAYRHTSRKKSRKPAKATAWAKVAKSAPSRKARTRSASATGSKRVHASAQNTAATAIRRVDLAEYERADSSSR